MTPIPKNYFIQTSFSRKGNDMSDVDVDHEKQVFLANDFVKLLRGHDKGRLSTKAEEKLREVVDAVRKHGRKGALKLTVDVLPPSEKGEDPENVMLSVRIDVVANAPEPIAPARVYFTTKEGGLSKHHPRQLGLFGED